MSYALSDPVPLDAQIPCAVYRIFGPHPHTGTRVKVYIGQCVDTARRGPRERFYEHLEDKTWGDTITTRDFDAALADGTIEVTYGYTCKRAALLAEQRAIVAEAPLYNWVHNELNPNRITKREQVRLRAERDRINGVPTHLTWAALYGDRPVTWWRRPQVWWRKLRRRQRRQVMSALYGVTATSSLSTFLIVAGLSPASAIVIAAAVVAWIVLWFKKPSRRRLVRYHLNEGARMGLVGVVLYQVFHDIGLLPGLF